MAGTGPLSQRAAGATGGQPHRRSSNLRISEYLLRRVGCPRTRRPQHLSRNRHIVYRICLPPTMMPRSSPDCDACPNLYCGSTPDKPEGWGCDAGDEVDNGRCGTKAQCIPAGQKRDVSDVQCCSGSEGIDMNDPANGPCLPGILPGKRGSRRSRRACVGGTGRPGTEVWSPASAGPRAAISRSSRRPAPIPVPVSSTLTTSHSSFGSGARTTALMARQGTRSRHQARPSSWSPSRLR